MSHVTIFLSTYNGEAYLEEAILSVFRQTHSDFEFLIIDDGSSDQTLTILKKLSDLDSRLKVVENRVNRGTGYSYSQLIANAKGDVLASIGQDDIWDPTFLERSLEALANHPEASVSFAKVRIIDSKGFVQPKAESPFRLELASGLNREELSCVLLKHNLFCAASAVFRRVNIIGWQTLGDNDQLQDWETWLNLIFKGEFYFLDACLVSYRIHGSNLSMSGHSPPQAQAEKMHVRTSVLSSEPFANFILKSTHANDLFQKTMTAMSETIDPNDGAHYFLLLYAMKKNEHLLRTLPAFQAIMAMLHLYTGAFGKSFRYTYLVDAMSTCPPYFWQGFEWRYLVSIGNAQAKIKNVQFIRERKIAGVRIFKFLVRKNSLPKVGFTYLLKAKSVDQLIEQHLGAHRLSFKKKLSLCLHSLGMGPFIIRVKSIGRSVVGEKASNERKL